MRWVLYRHDLCCKPNRLIVACWNAVRKVNNTQIMNRRFCYQLELENNFTNNSTQLSSGWKWRSVNQVDSLYPCTLWRIHNAVAEHAWENHHPIHREETTMVDHLAEDKSYWWKRLCKSRCIPRGARQPRWRTGSPFLLDCHEKEAGERNNPNRPLTTNDMYPQ